jgi:alcohol dehydrogenase
MSVAVVGSGPVGLLAQMVAHALGAGPVFAIDPEPARLEKAQALGSFPINPKAEDAVGRVRQATEGLGAELVVEAVGGDGEALKTALKLAAPGGVVSSLGVPTAERLDYPWLAAFSRGITLRSALANIPRFITEVLALQRVGRLRGSFVFSHRLPLGEAATGYRLFHERQATKVALVP